MDKQKLRVVWICHFSNENIRSRLTFSSSLFEIFLRAIARKPQRNFGANDFGNWISQGICEFEKYPDVELHVVAPFYGIKQRIKRIVINDINYWFFKPDHNSFVKRWFKKLIKTVTSSYKGNRKIVRNLIESIQPDIIHMYGAENPYYSITALDIEIDKYPFLVSLQTLASHPDFKYRTNMHPTQYDFISGIEKRILQRAAYIGSSVNIYRDFIWQKINPRAVFTNTFLGIPEDMVRHKQVKIFDFVYFSAAIDKAADLAIEAFALASQKEPSITLNIVGGETVSFKRQLVKRINHFGISDNVVFSGKLPTFDDVIKQINKSKFALLPLKIDVISGTVREAMFAGLPVVSTITSGTPSLNETRESILISEIGDHEAMANNMLKLLNSEEFADKIRQNALLTAKERWNNARNMSELVEAYRAIIAHHKHGTPIPKEIGAVNPAIEQT
jgi:glycosyltransferase involved in cell wall biosynthesis